MDTVPYAAFHELQECESGIYTVKADLQGLNKFNTHLLKHQAGQRAVTNTAEIEALLKQFKSL